MASCCSAIQTRFSYKSSSSSLSTPTTSQTAWLWANLTAESREPWLIILAIICTSAKLPLRPWPRAFTIPILSAIICKAQTAPMRFSRTVLTSLLEPIAKRSFLFFRASLIALISSTVHPERFATVLCLTLPFSRNEVLSRCLV